MKKISLLVFFAIITLTLTNFFVLKTSAIEGGDIGGGDEPPPPQLPMPRLIVNQIISGSGVPSDHFEFRVGNNGSWFSPPSSEEIILQPGSFNVTSTAPLLYTILYSGQCNGEIVRGDFKTCIITYDFRLEAEATEETPPSGSSSEPIVTNGENIGGGSGYHFYEIVINNNDSETDSQKVMLNLSATNVTEIMISNSPIFEGAIWESFANQKEWTLESGEGVKQVYAKFQGVGNGGEDSDDITLKNKTNETVAGSSESEVGGQVLGATTNCGEYLNGYLSYDSDNDSNEVKKLQSFLNDYFQASLAITGFFGPLTLDVVKQFQIKHAEEILSPWVKEGLLEPNSPTGMVYKTTKRWINMMVCPSLNLPLPEIK